MRSVDMRSVDMRSVDMRSVDKTTSNSTASVKGLSKTELKNNNELDGSVLFRNNEEHHRN